MERITTFVERFNEAHAKRGDGLKILQFSHNGFCLMYKERQLLEVLREEVKAMGRTAERLMYFFEEENESKNEEQRTINN